MLSRALIQFALDLNSDAYEEIRPPTLVRTDTMVSTGHLPKFVDEAYHLERDDLWAIPTAEVPLTSLARDEVIAEADLPMRLMAHTACFRREAGSAGRDTRGLLRVHEFDKVEILAYATPEQAQDMHAELLGRAERSISLLGLAYRIVDLCTGDLGNSSARTFDIEVYAARLRPVARGVVGVVVQRLPSPKGQRALQADGGWSEPGAPHAQRLGARRAPRVGGRRRDPSAARWQRRDPRSAVALHAGCHSDLPLGCPP